MSPEERIEHLRLKQNQRVKNYNQRKRNQGLVKVECWVKEENKKTLKELAEELRKA